MEIPGPQTQSQRDLSTSLDWIGLSSVLHPHQHSIGYMGDGFNRSKYPTNSIKSTEGTYTVSQKKNCATFIFTVTLANVG